MSGSPDSEKPATNPDAGIVDIPKSSDVEILDTSGSPEATLSNTPEQVSEIQERHLTFKVSQMSMPFPPPDILLAYGSNAVALVDAT